MGKYYIYLYLIYENCLKAKQQSIFLTQLIHFYKSKRTALLKSKKRAPQKVPPLEDLLQHH